MAAVKSDAYCLFLLFLSCGAAQCGSCMTEQQSLPVRPRFKQDILDEECAQTMKNHIWPNAERFVQNGPKAAKHSNAK